MLIGQRHRLLRYWDWSSARRYIFTIPAHNLPRLHTSNVDKFNERNGFTLKRLETDDTPPKIITDADYTDDIAPLVNTFTEAKSLLHSPKQAAGDIGLQTNVEKTEYMCFNQEADMSTLKGSSLKLVDEFTYLGSSVSSTESGINIRLAKAWTAMDWQYIIW